MTFHRAIDMTRDIFKSAEIVRDLGKIWRSDCIAIVTSLCRVVITYHLLFARISDLNPHSVYADPEPAFQANVDQDSANFSTFYKLLQEKPENLA
jgi:hypothetical protein